MRRDICMRDDWYGSLRPRGTRSRIDFMVFLGRAGGVFGGKIPLLMIQSPLSGVRRCSGGESLD